MKPSISSSVAPAVSDQDTRIERFCANTEKFVGGSGHDTEVAVGLGVAEGEALVLGLGVGLGVELFVGPGDALALELGEEDASGVGSGVSVASSAGLDSGSVDSPALGASVERETRLPTVVSSLDGEALGLSSELGDEPGEGASVGDDSLRDGEIDSDSVGETLGLGDPPVAVEVGLVLGSRDDFASTQTGSERGSSAATAESQEEDRPIPMAVEAKSRATAATTRLLRRANPL